MFTNRLSENSPVKCLAVMIPLIWASMDRISSAVLIDYTSIAEAAVEINPYVSDLEIDEGQNRIAFAERGWSVKYVGGLGMAASSGGSVNANDVTLFSGIGGTFWLDDDLWTLAEYFDQRAYSRVSGEIDFSEYPAGTALFLQIDVTFPDVAWDGGWEWEVEVSSGMDSFHYGQISNQSFGSCSGLLRALANEPVKFVVEQTASGHAPPKNGLGEGVTTINVSISTISVLVGDLNADGQVNLFDFEPINEYWGETDCDDPNLSWCAGTDFNRSGTVDVDDAIFFSQNWLENVTLPDPNDPNCPFP